MQDGCKAFAMLLTASAPVAKSVGELQIPGTLAQVRVRCSMRRKWIVATETARTALQKHRLARQLDGGSACRVGIQDPRTHVGHFRHIGKGSRGAMWLNQCAGDPLQVIALVLDGEG